MFYENDFDFHENKRADESTKCHFGTKEKAGNPEVIFTANNQFSNILLDTSKTRR